MALVDMDDAGEKLSEEVRALAPVGRKVRRMLPDHRHGSYRYLQILENHREGKRTGQRVLATLGRADELAESGGIDVLLKSMGRFATQVRVIQDYEEGRLEAGDLLHIRPDLVFGGLWKELDLKLR